MMTATRTGEKVGTGPPTAQPGILVVDDEDAVRQLLHLSLQLHGFRVWTAAGGAEALEVYQAHRDAIALVLLDVRMPGMVGPAVYRALETLDPEARIAFMSGNLGVYTEVELLALGARAVLSKPFDLVQLATMLHELAAR